MREVVVVGACRTPIGAFQGTLAALSAPELGAAAIAGALARSGVAPEEVQEVLLGCVLQAGLGQAPARQAALGAGLPVSIPCTTINKVCGSGLMAVLQAMQAIRLGEAEVMVAGGMESMSRVPYYLPGARAGMRLGHASAVDGLILDGLWDPGSNQHMGACAEKCAREHRITRAEQDAYTAESYRRALAAQRSGRLAAEITPVCVPSRKGPPLEVTLDEEPARGDPARLAGLRPAFAADGTVTAGNASTLADGAAALVLMEAGAAARRGLRPLCTLLAGAGHAQAPEWFTTAPAPAIAAALAKSGLAKDDVDLYEINEAFAVVALANQRLLGLDPARVNVDGGAVSLGHPLGATGARLLVTLLHSLAARQLRYGCAALCIGGGEALALTLAREKAA